MTRARWVFLRAYLLFVLLLTVVGFGLEQLLENRHTQQWEARESSLLAGSFHYAQGLTIPDNQKDRQILEKALSQQLQLPARLYATSDFASLSATDLSLDEKHIFRLYNERDEAIFYQALPGDEWVLALGPAPVIGNALARWIVPLFYGAVAIAVFIGIRPLMRDLDALQQAASAFGEQDFSTRVSVPSSSWLSPLGEAFNAMAVRIQWLLQSHRELTHAVSHELRTPLARIRFSLEMLDSEPESNQRHKESINRDVEELNVLIDEMLSYAELDKAHLNPKLEPVDMTSWLYQYIENYNQTLTGIRVSLKLNGNRGKALADKRLIQRALDNLLGNAQKYANDEISVRLQISETHCFVRVCDDGPGIPPEKRTAALSAFTRLEPSSGGVTHGFGLGLAIVKRIMDLHGGEVVLQNRNSGGADIGLYWPL
ncbi:MAG: ATP-binding protein [Halioglobus sp.]